MANPTFQHAHCWTNRTSAEGSTTGEEGHTFLKESETPICSLKILKGRPAPTLQLSKLLNVKIGQSVQHGSSIKSIVRSSCTQSFVKRSWGWAEVCYIQSIPGCTASMYQVSTPYTAASMMSIIMERPRLKSSPSTGDWLIVLHWMPTPATSYSAKYLEPRPNAVVDIRDWKRDDRWFSAKVNITRNPMWWS